MKKEIAIAACSAVALILFLGSASYLLFPPVSVQGYTASIDVYTQNGGKGINKPSGNFTLNMTLPPLVILYAEVKNASNMPVAGRLVSFEVHWPLNGSILFVGVNATDSLGLASYRFRIPPTNSSLGKWLVYATVDVNGQSLADTVTFFVADPLPPFS
ncbi:MAG TPA: hypothetical protein VK487_06140 [Candidatus Bathyarchaeia archaeon]|nr:hypothetical protein [Candidatus Bathyarchaeia archaeon]